MGDWIKENKFEALLLLVVVLVALGAFFFGSKQGKAYNEAKAVYGSAKDSVENLQRKKPFPTIDNAKKFAAQVDGYKTVIEGLQDKMVAYRPETFEEIAPSKFIENLNAARSALMQSMAAKNITFPEDKFHMGFETYSGALPDDKATSYLSYQLSAVNALFESLVAARPSELINVYREQLPVEKGQPMEGKADDKKSAGKSSRKTTKGSQEKTPPYYRLPLELTFKSSEPVARKVLSDLASHKDHYFVVKAVRIQNENRDSAPEKDDVKFDKPIKPVGGPEEDFPEFDTEPADPADPAAPEGDPAPEDPLPPIEEPEEGNRILGQVLGAEEVYVFLQVDIILFKPKGEVTLP